jgi:hypothetical protein
MTMADTKLPQIMPAGGQVVAVVPQSVEEIFRVASGVLAAGLAPYALIGKKNPDQQKAAVAITIMAGAELGLPPMVSLRAFTVINGRPALYGDGLVAVIRKSGKLKRLAQGYDHDKQFGWAEAERADTGEVMRYEFTKQEAIDAGLWDERATITNYKGETVPNPEPWFRWKPRMMMIRARTFVLRDLFADVLGGMTDEYEARDIQPPIDITPPKPSDILPPVPEDDDPPKGGNGGGAAEQGATAGAASTESAPTGQLHNSDQPEGGENEVRHPATGEPMTNTRPAPDLDAYFARVVDEVGEIEGEDDFLAAWADLKVEEQLAGNDAALDRAEEIRREQLARIAAAGRGELEAQGQGVLFMPEVPN